MKVIYRTNDPVILSWLPALLSDAGIKAFVLDSYGTEGRAGYLGTVQRVMVTDDDYRKARNLVIEAGLKPAT